MNELGPPPSSWLILASFLARFETGGGQLLQHLAIWGMACRGAATKHLPCASINGFIGHSLSHNFCGSESEEVIASPEQSTLAVDRVTKSKQSVPCFFRFAVYKQKAHFKSRTTIKDLHMHICISVKGKYEFMAGAGLGEESTSLVLV